MKPNRNKNIIISGSINVEHEGVTFTNTANRATGHIICAKIDGSIDYHAFFTPNTIAGRTFFQVFPRPKTGYLKKYPNT